LRIHLGCGSRRISFRLFPKALACDFHSFSYALIEAAVAANSFVREHQQPSFLEYGEYPFFTAYEIKKTLRVKSAVSENAGPVAVGPKENV